MKIKFLFPFVILLSLNLSGQYLVKRDIKKADKLFDKLAYMDAALIYERIIDEGVQNASLYRKLGDIYFYNSDYERSLVYYNKFLEQKKDSIDQSLYFRIGQVMLANNLNDQADEYFDRFHIYQKNSERYDSILQIKDEELKSMFSVDRKLELTTVINTEFSEYPAFVRNGRMYYVTDKDAAKRNDPWTNKYFTRIKYIDLDSSKVVKNLFNKPLKLHEGSVAISKDETFMFLTLNGDSKDTEVNEDGIRTLKIYKSLQLNGEWTKPELVSISNSQYNTAHPALDSDNKFLYFSSDRPGGYGQSDIYKVALENGVIVGDVVNLGKEVNTIGRESFPQIDPLGQLLFSSDGHKGFGGFDLFGYDLNSEDAEVINLGQPLNSSFDDFNYVFDTDLRGYFASNRGGKTGDDIYTFIQNEQISFNPYNKIRGIMLTDAGLPIDRALLVVEDKSRNKVSEGYTDAKGAFVLTKLPVNSALVLRVFKEEFAVKEIYFETKPGFKIIDLPDIELLEKWKTEPYVLDLASYFDLNSIYFEFDSAEIREASVEPLKQVAALMTKYDDMVLEIKSHTDPYGSELYNMKLSNERAISTMNYLISLGVDENRISAKGYGESKLLKDCSTCSKDENLINRRSEFLVSLKK